MNSRFNPPPKRFSGIAPPTRVATMGFAADFTAIDFETASRRDDSACQLGMVKVRSGRVVDQACWLIRPKPLYFHHTNIQIHGITPQQVQQEPEFGELWPEIAARIGDDCLVAHNAAFDLRVLIASLKTHRQAVPELLYTCTRAIARRTWPHHRRYGLKPLSEWLGIRFRHHDALEDAMACAKILLAAGIDREADSLSDLEKRLRLKRGHAGAWGMRSPSGSSRPRSASSRPVIDAGPLPFLMPNQMGAGPVGHRDGASPVGHRDSANPVGHGQGPTRSAAGDRYRGDSQLGAENTLDLQRLLVRAEFIRPLAGMQVVLQGKFRVLSDEDARCLAIRSGATCQEAVDDSTDFLVVGTAPTTKSPKQEGEPCQVGEPKPDRDDTTGVEQVEPSSAKRQRSMRVVSEHEFLEMLGSPPPTR